MVTALCDRAVSTKHPLVRVSSGQTITLESKGTDGSLKINFNVNNNHYPLMFYFLRFFLRGSSHRIYGSLNVSAFIFDDSTRPYASVRVGVESVAPIRELDYAGQSIGTTLPLGYMPVNETVAPFDREYKKLKFLIFSYVWYNWDYVNLVVKEDTYKEAFSKTLEDLYFNLVQEEIITCDCNAVDYKEKAERKSTKMKCSRRKIIEQVPNRRIKEVKFDRDDFADFKSLMDDSIPFPDSFFILEDETDHGEGAANAAKATSASNSVNVDDSDGCD